MLETELFTLVRTALLEGIAARQVGEPVAVERGYQPLTMGVNSGPTVLMQSISNYRYGSMRREEIPVFEAGEITHFIHREVQWWETTLQINGMARRDPTKPDFLTALSAMDIAKMASDILQGDAGMSVLAAERVRPLRVTQIRTVQFVNESDQYEASPSFDVVLVYPEAVYSETPSAAVEGQVLNIGDNRP